MKGKGIKDTGGECGERTREYSGSLGKGHAWLAPVMVLGIWANMAWK